MRFLYAFTTLLFAALILASLWHGLSGIHIASNAKLGGCYDRTWEVAASGGSDRSDYVGLLCIHYDQPEPLRLRGRCQSGRSSSSGGGSRQSA
jgi:hypothetical protein